MKEEKITRQPKVRFREFSGENAQPWEQRKVGELLIERNQKAPMNDEYPLMAFIANEGVVPKGERYDRSALVTDSTNKLYKKTEFGDFIYSSNNLESGSIGLNKYGKASISPVYSIFYPSKNTDTNFVGYRMVRNDFINSMIRWRQGVIYGQWRIHESDFVKINIIVPIFEEQKLIGSIFKSLDHLITLHQRKAELLKEIKSTLLSKLFPKNGEVVPELRFKGFTEAWEQRKFSDIASRETLQIDSSKELPFVEYEDVLAEEGRLDKDITNKEVIKKGVYFDGSHVLYGKLRPYLHNWLNPDFSGVAVGDWWVLKPNNANKNFLFRLIQTQKFDVIANQSAGSKMPRADWNLISSTVFFVPISMDEQLKIGESINNLDTLITLHQRKYH